MDLYWHGEILCVKCTEYLYLPNLTLPANCLRLVMAVGFGYDIRDHSQVLLNHGCFDMVLITRGSGYVEWLPLYRIRRSKKPYSMVAWFKNRRFTRFVLPNISVQ